MMTIEQVAFVEHIPGVFVTACPGAGKTRSVVARIEKIAKCLPIHRGIAILSFTNTAVEEFIHRCYANGLSSMLQNPSFVGTFDAFLRQFFLMPSGIEAMTNRPIVIDSWDTLKIEVRLLGRNAFRGPGVSLDHFDSENNLINPNSIQNIALRQHIENHQADYQKNAAKLRHALHRKGYLSAADARVIVARCLERADWSAALGKALAARFHEVIVDEAQDCNSFDCQIINWLRNTGISVSVVADPDQAIYEFRNSNPGELRAIENSYDPLNRLSLTGNFRGSAPICNIAATLRDRAEPDRSLGETAVIKEPIHIFVYGDKTVPITIGSEFRRLMERPEIGIKAKGGIVLSHKRINAFRACGISSEEDVGNSRVASIARTVGIFWSPLSTGRARETAIQTIERTILELMGKIDDNELPSRAAERQGLDKRWLRRLALQLISKIPHTCDNTDEARKAWIIALREATRNLGLAYSEGITEGQYFAPPQKKLWHSLLTIGNESNLTGATIHEAKGKEYEAVCVVIPPDFGGSHRTEQLITSWENREENEAKRVIYVGITRAKKLGVIALPTRYRDRVAAILERSLIFWEEHNL